MYSCASHIVMRYPHTTGIIMSQFNRSTLAILIANLLAAVGCSTPFRSDALSVYLVRAGVEPLVQELESDTKQSEIQDQGLDEHDLSLSQLLDYAESSNPELKAARLAIGSATSLSWQAGLYPNPSIEITSGEIGFRADSANTVIGVRQPIVIGSRLHASVAEGTAQKKVFDAEVVRVRLMIYGQIAELHAQVLGLNEQVLLVNELLSIAEQTLEIAELRFNERASAEPDVIRPRVEVYRLRADQIRISQELNTAQEQLGLLLNLKSVSAARLSDQIDLAPEPIRASVIREAVRNNHPILLVMDKKINAIEAKLNRIRAERVPDLQFHVGIGYSEEGDQGIAEIGVGAEIPLWDRRDGDIMAVRFDLMRVRQERVAVENQLLSELAGNLGEYASAVDQLNIIRDQVVPEAQRAFEQIEGSYRAGRASFIDLLEAQRSFIQSRRMLVELAGLAALSKARVAKMSGAEILVNLSDTQVTEHNSNPALDPYETEKTK